MRKDSVWLLEALPCGKLAAYAWPMPWSQGDFIVCHFDFNAPERETGKKEKGRTEGRKEGMKEALSLSAKSRFFKWHPVPETTSFRCSLARCSSLHFSHSIEGGFEPLICVLGRDEESDRNPCSLVYVAARLLPETWKPLQPLADPVAMAAATEASTMKVASKEAYKNVSIEDIPLFAGIWSHLECRWPHSDTRECLR